MRGRDNVFTAAGSVKASSRRVFLQCLHNDKESRYKAILSIKTSGIIAMRD